MARTSNAKGVESIATTLGKETVFSTPITIIENAEQDLKTKSGDLDETEA